VNVQPVGETSHRWRLEADVYQVFFWRALGNLKPRPLHIGVPYSSATFELTGVRDVFEALDWANANADGRTFTLYVVDNRFPGEVGLIKVFGINPTRGYVSFEQQQEVERLFQAHGFTGELLMHPVTTVDERAFVVKPEELAAMTAVPELIASLERLLEAPVRIDAMAVWDVFDPERP